MFSCFGQNSGQEQAKPANATPAHPSASKVRYHCWLPSKTYLISSALELFHAIPKDLWTSVNLQTIVFVSLVFPLGNASLDRHCWSRQCLRLFPSLLSYRFPMKLWLCISAVNNLSHQILSGSLFWGWIHASSRFSSATAVVCMESA